MKPQPPSSSVIKPEWSRKRLLRCEKCGCLFMGIKIPLVTKCPGCGSLNVHEDKRARY